MEGNDSEKGYDSNIEDHVEGGTMSLKGGVGCSSQKKNKKAKGSDSNQDSDFEEGWRRESQKKESGGKGTRIRSHDYDRVSVPSNEETL